YRRHGGKPPGFARRNTVVGGSDRGRPSGLRPRLALPQSRCHFRRHVLLQEARYSRASVALLPGGTATRNRVHERIPIDQDFCPTRPSSRSTEKLVGRL